MNSEAYTPRLVDPVLSRLLEQFPAIFITGPRAAGKTTTAQRRSATTVSLDEPATAVPFVADPDAALRGLPEPVLIDEWQAVPSVLGALKRTIDKDSRPGRFLITGSAQAYTGPGPWPGTGRFIPIRMWGLSQREIAHAELSRPTLIERLIAAVDLQGDETDLRDYALLITSPGFPRAVALADSHARTLWLEGYVEQLVTRDLSAFGVRHASSKFQRYLQALSINTSCELNISTLAEAADIDHGTAKAYESTLESLRVIDRLVPWYTNKLKRLVKQADKRHVVDTGLAAFLAGVDAEGVMRDGTMLGRLLESWVVAQLRAETSVMSGAPRLHYLRDRDGRHEVDLIAELRTGDIVAIEIKAVAGPERDHAKHLIWLRDQLGDRFLRGAVLHTGRYTYQLEERILAVPISALWASGSA